MPAAVEILDVSKRFRIGDQKIRSFKERFVTLRRQHFHDFWALRDVGFEVDEGETIGLLGHNGSGKSTLLKLVGGIMQPTSGEIRVRGRLASLLELGAGFHPDLSGRENVYLNAAILGMTRHDVDARFDEIVEFAELEEFIDLQVKHYSSGMYVRLGFAVAVNVDPDVLLVDEVLAVGDETFQRKCLERIQQFQRDGRTIVVVSHAADLMRQICDRVAVLDHGHLVTYGPPGESIRTFRETLFANAMERQAWLDARAAEEAAASALPSAPAPVAVPGAPVPEPVADAADEVVPLVGPEERVEPEPAPEPAPVGEPAAPAYRSPLRITAVDVEHPHRDERAYLLPGEPLTVRLAFETSEPLEDVVFGIAVWDDQDHVRLYGANTKILEVDVPRIEGPGEVRFEFGSVPLLDGRYPITLHAHSRDEGTSYALSDQEHWFSVMNPDRRVGLVALPLEVKISP